MFSSTFFFLFNLFCFIPFRFIFLIAKLPLENQNTNPVVEVLRLVKIQRKGIPDYLNHSNIRTDTQTMDVL